MPWLMPPVSDPIIAILYAFVLKIAADGVHPQTRDDHRFVTGIRDTSR